MKKLLIVAIASLALNSKAQQKTIIGHGKMKSYYVLVYSANKRVIEIYGKDTVVLDSSLAIKTLLIELNRVNKEIGVFRELLSLPSSFSFKTAKDKNKFLQLKKIKP